jgi:hypothetical protein
MGIRARSILLATAGAGIFTTASLAQTPAPDEAAFRALYKQLVEVNTTRTVSTSAFE